LKTVKNIGKYLIEERIAKGGMGEVFLGIHPTLNRKVVIKKLTFRGNREIQDRFKQEAEIMMDLKHDGIVTVYDHFKEGQFFYLVLEYIDGISLDRIIKRDGALEPGDIALISYDISKSLEYTHSKGIIHRDIKPGNVLVSKDGHVKITDFGIASLGSGDSIDTRSKLDLLGTPAYMSPEQISNFSNIDEQSDIYSFSVLLYEMLTGLKPFMGEVNNSFYANIKKGRYYSVRKMNKKASKFLAKISKKGMKRKKLSRYKKFRIIREELAKYIKRNSAITHRKSLGALVEGASQSVEFKKILENKKTININKRKKRILHLLISLAVLFFMIIIGSITVVGIPFKIINSKNMGEFSVEVDTIENITLYREKRDKLEIIKRPIIFTKSGSFLKSIPIALPVGYYRLKSTAMNQVQYSSFFIDSYQSKNNNGVKLSFTKGIESKIDLKFNFYDSITRKDISDKVTVEIRVDKDFYPIKEYFNNIYAGKSYHIRLIAEGYFTDNYTIESSLGDRVFSLYSGLIPRPATLTLNGELNKAKIMINSKNYYLEGGITQEYKAIEKAGKSISFRLNPGQYIIKVGDESISLSLKSLEKRVLLYPFR